MIKRPYLSVTLLLLSSMCILGACEKEKSHTVLELFSESQSLSQKKDFYVNEDSIAIIEGLSCDGKNLIVNDYHSGCCYTLFDKNQVNISLVLGLSDRVRLNCLHPVMAT